jgi:hypothetical protein
MPEHLEDPRTADEWRVEVALEKEQQGKSLGDRLHELRLDDAARKRLGGSVIVTRDGRFLFLYAWHEESAREAERVVRDLMKNDKLAGEVRLMRWHPVAEEWKDADTPLPADDAALAAEMAEHETTGREEHRESGQPPWEVVIDVPTLRETIEIGRRLRDEGLRVKRRFRYLLIGCDSEEDAVDLGKRLEGEVPENAHVGIRGNPEDMPLPGFVQLGSLKPGFLRDLGL